MTTMTTSEGKSHLASTNRQYWLLQVVGWSAMATVSYLSLTLWYNPGQWIPAFHTLLQSALGLLVSHPLRYIARRSWTRPLPARIVFNGIGIVVAAILWTSLRLWTFEILTGEHVSAADWGGWFFASIITFGSWSFCYHAIKYYRQWLEQRELVLAAQAATLEARERAQAEEVKRLQTETLFKEAQMRMLKYQLNPHFLFNALNSVTARVKQGDSTDAATMLARIGDFLRMALEHDDELDHSLLEEVEMLELYLEIEKARFGDRLQTEFLISDTARHAVIPSLLLQPLVENAIKHGVGRRLGPTLVRIAAWTEDGRLELRVVDTGEAPVRAGGDRRDVPGIGLSNTRERLQSVYGEDFVLRLEDAEPNGTMAAISFPLEGTRADEYRRKVEESS